MAHHSYLVKGGTYPTRHSDPKGGRSVDRLKSPEEDDRRQGDDPADRWREIWLGILDNKGGKPTSERGKTPDGGGKEQRSDVPMGLAGTIVNRAAPDLLETVVVQ